MGALEELDVLFELSLVVSGVSIELLSDSGGGSSGGGSILGGSSATTVSDDEATESLGTDVVTRVSEELAAASAPPVDAAIVSTGVELSGEEVVSVLGAAVDVVGGSGLTVGSVNDPPGPKPGNALISGCCTD